MTAAEWNTCEDIGAMLDALAGRTNAGILEEFFTEERFPFPRFPAVLVRQCHEQGLPLTGSEWVQLQWPTAADSVRACAVLRLMFRGVFAEVAAKGGANGG